MSSDFDIAAVSYDNTFTETYLGRYQRNNVWRYLSQNLSNQKSLRILELNCGTGEDALFFARSGHNVVATDISNEMITACISKVNKNGFTHLVSAKQVDMRKLSSTTFEGHFDLVFSNFGGLNCLSREHLFSLAQVTQALLVDHGRFIAVVMPKFCAIESLHFMIKRKFSHMFRRYTTEAIAVNVDGVKIPTFYHSPKELKNIFSQEFNHLRTTAIGFIPSYMNKMMEKNKIKRIFVFALRGILSSFRAYSFSDHFLIDFRKENILQ